MRRFNEYQSQSARIRATRTCDCTLAILSAGKLNSLSGTFASFRKRKNPSSLGNRNIRLLPTFPARAVRPTRWM